MGAEMFTCPQCLFPVWHRPGLRFCPRCGLPDAPAAAADDGSPLDLAVGGRTYRVFDRVAVGAVCSVYRCRFDAGRAPVEGVLKVARDARTNDLVANEAAVLRRLHAADPAGRFAPFLPAVEATVAVGGGDPSGPPRCGNVLRMHGSIRSPADDLYTLADVRAAYPAGLDARDVAWIWRRLLAVLGFAHSQGVVHAAVLPVHVLIEPREHKLVLIDWCSAADAPPGPGWPPALVHGGYASWYRREGALRVPPTPGLDIALGSRCMVDLLGGDALRGEVPPTVDRALGRYFGRCLGKGTAVRADARKLLHDFDRLIEALWGPRRFRALVMPPKRKS